MGKIHLNDGVKVCSDIKEEKNMSVKVAKIPTSSSSINTTVNVEEQTDDLEKSSFSTLSLLDTLSVTNFEEHKKPEASINIKVFKKDFKVNKNVINRVVKLLIIMSIMTILLLKPTMKDKLQSRSLALLVTISLLYSTEAIPLYTTSMITPFLVVLFKVVRNESVSTNSDNQSSAMSAQESSSFILSTMWSSVIMVLFSGLVLSHTLNKYGITTKLASKILIFSRTTDPKVILLVIMSISCFLSMWISNVASPVICLSLIEPILQNLDAKDSIAKSFVLGIALAANVGGMTSPIASPQNVIAMEQMIPYCNWAKWLAISVPVSILSLLLIWLLLISTFKYSGRTITITQSEIKFYWRHYVIITVTLITIGLWCVLSPLSSIFGQAGIIAFIPIIMFPIFNIFTKADLNSLQWDIILLAMGGTCLGKAIKSSGLLTTIATSLLNKISSFNIWYIFMIFGLVTLIVATFVSHTVAAMIIVPLVKEVGENLASSNKNHSQNHSVMLIMSCALISSAAMGLPTSGFPNVTVISLCDKNGERYLSVWTFISRGVASSCIVYLLIISLGYGIMAALKF